MGEEQWGTVHYEALGERMTGLQWLNIGQGDLGEREVESSGVTLDIQRQMSQKAKDRVLASLIKRPTVAIIQQVGSVCKGTCLNGA